jgi:hypothetical protein
MINTNDQLPTTSSTAAVHEHKEMQGALTLTFRDFDQKFTSIRFPSRRHTVMHGSTMITTDSPITIQPLSTSSSSSMSTSDNDDNVKWHILDFDKNQSNDDNDKRIGCCGIDNNSTINAQLIDHTSIDVGAKRFEHQQSNYHHPRCSIL